jgi:DNA-binding NarL/FixJ family response regulator
MGMDQLSSFQSLRVVIADDHPFYREGLARLLRESGIEVVGEVPNAEAAIEIVEETAPDVVIMDLRMPGLSALEATRRLSERAPASRVLVLSASAQEADVADAILAGASGYVLKDRPVEEVVAGIRAVAAGEALISSRVATALRRRVRDLAEAGVDLASVRLSSRELEVLELLAAGKHNYEIAEMLAISPSAVRKHMSSVLQKLQSRIE